MYIRTTGICLALVLGAFTIGCGGDKEDSSAPAKVDTAPAGDAMARAKGAVKFGKTCATCHGADAKGMPNNGKDLTISEFFRDSTDEELVAFVNVGRPATDTAPLMPPKGGFVDLTDEDIMNVIKYLRTIQQ